MIRTVSIVVRLMYAVYVMDEHSEGFGFPH
jgi:hypothetical protein